MDSGLAGRSPRPGMTHPSVRVSTLVDRFDETDHVRRRQQSWVQSFRGATARWRARNPYPSIRDYGFRARRGACDRAGRRPDPLAAPRNDAAYDSNFNIAELRATDTSIPLPPTARAS